MTTVGDVVFKVRSKNAGPFWVTVDVFCGASDVFERLRPVLTSARVASIYGQAEDAIRRFEIPDLNVIKLSFPRPVVQGSREDRDMHGAQWAVLLAEAEI